MINFRKQRKLQLEYQEEYYQSVVEAVEFLRTELDQFRPYLAVALGSGVDQLGEEKSFSIVDSFAYQDLPHFPTPAVAGHTGRLVFAEFSEIPFVILQGRVHGYEVMDFPAGPVWGLKMATLPWRVLKGLGIDEVITTHACGAFGYGKNKARVGNLGLVFDHTNLVGISPLLGLNDQRFGKRFSAKGNILDAKMLEDFTKGLNKNDYHLAHYLTTLSMPNYEGLGDLSVGLLKEFVNENNPDLLALFGMSMSFEADVINHFVDVPENKAGGLNRQVRYLPIGLITNLIKDLKTPTVSQLVDFEPNPTSHQEVLQAKNKVLKTLLKGLKAYLNKLENQKRFSVWQEKVKRGLEEGLI